MSKRKTLKELGIAGAAVRLGLAGTIGKLIFDAAKEKKEKAKPKSDPEKDWLPTMLNESRKERENPKVLQAQVDFLCRLGESKEDVEAVVKGKKEKLENLVDSWIERADKQSAGFSVTEKNDVRVRIREWFQFRFADERGPFSKKNKAPKEPLNEETLKAAISEQILILTDLQDEIARDKLRENTPK